MSRVEARRLDIRNRDEALALLGRDPVANLFLIDLVTRFGGQPAPGEAPTELVGAWRGESLEAIAALRPSIGVSAAPADVIRAFLPFFEPIGVGLMKCSKEVADVLWQSLAHSRRRHVLLDRVETAYVLRRLEARLVPPRPSESVRAAELGDLDALIVAARESLREEERPDPFAGDARSFKRWVRGRIGRARVVESGGAIRCVGYGDVRLRDGWLIQGVYCWPEVRRRGFATTGVSDLCHEAFEAGAEHVQLAVVEGNVAGQRLYEGLGFKAMGLLRTILFH
jgi:ribosomal protein S18 acetylase RimI-like enzyme